MKEPDSVLITVNEQVIALACLHARPENYQLVTSSKATSVGYLDAT